MINKITKEQEAEIPNFIERFIKKASEPIDRSNLRELSKTIWGEEKIVIVGESIKNTIDLIKYATNGEKIEYRSSQLDSQLDSQLYSQNIKYSYYTSYYLQDWAGYYYYAKNIGVEFDEKSLQEYFDIILNIPIVIFVGEVIFVCEKPKCLWEEARLHSDQKPAIGWEDGTGFYFLDGVRFEKELWEKVISKTMSFSEIMKIEISDQRTVALKYNPQAIIKENAQLIHKDGRNNELYLIENQEINQITNFPKMYFLKMTCPTGRIFVEGVDPEFAEKHPNATQCQAELCGLVLSEYQSMVLES